VTGVQTCALPIFALSIAAIALVFAAAASAQKPATTSTQQPAQQRDDPAQRLGVLNVRLPISVKRDKKFVEGLTINNFEVYEDGTRQQIERFTSPSMLPLRIGLLIDTSNSVKLKLPFEKDAA